MRAGNREGRGRLVLYTLCTLTLMPPQWYRENVSNEGRGGLVHRCGCCAPLPPRPCPHTPLLPLTPAPSPCHTHVNVVLEHTAAAKHMHHGTKPQVQS